MGLDPCAFVRGDPRGDLQDIFVVFFKMPGEDRLVMCDPAPEWNKEGQRRVGVLT